MIDKNGKKIDQVKQLEYIYRTYGPMSDEFYKQVHKFVYKIIQKHYFNFQAQLDKEDILQFCFCRMYNSFNYYNPEKGSLATFIYYVIRNSIKSDIIDKKKLKGITYDYNDYVFDFDNVEANYDYLHNFNLSALHILRNLKYLSLSEQTMDDFLTMKTQNTILLRFIKWKQTTMK